MSQIKISSVASDSNVMYFEQDGKLEKASYTYYRGERANFHPRDDSIQNDVDLLKYFIQGLVPKAPLFGSDSSIIAFGSCFAEHISKYLQKIGYNQSETKGRRAYISTMGEGIVNTYAILQQLEWAWEAKQPTVELWHGYDAKRLGYDEEIRLETREIFNGADAFVITLGLSEIWYDEPTGEVFWRAIPNEYFDPTRHRFRVSSYSESLKNLSKIYSMIRQRKSNVPIIFTLSPIPLAATFRPIPCVVADSASKAILRSALDELLTASSDENLFYFPSYEIVQRAFDHPYMEDRRHPHKHVLDFNMSVFERYFCKTGMSDEDLRQRFVEARAWDQVVVRDGHWAVPRVNLLFHSPPPGAKVFEAGGTVA